MALELKGSLFTLSVLHLTDNDLPQLSLALKQKVEQAPGFFYRAPIVINIDKIADTPIDFGQLKSVIEQLALVLVGISGGSNEQKQQAKQQGLAVLSFSDKQQSANNETPAPQVVEKTIERTVEKTVIKEVPVHKASKIIKNNIRSGQQVYAAESDLIIQGSVGHGAEIIADGNIHVYGTLRGRAVAGAKGDSSAKIYCQNIQAELVSINGNYMMSEQLQQQLWAKPATIELSEEKIIISELN